MDKTFTEVMRCYRLQPQAKNHIYRQVLLSTNLPESNIFSRENMFKWTLFTYIVFIGNNENISPSMEKPNHAVYGDLIKFYNTVFVQSMEKLITTFGREKTDVSCWITTIFNFKILRKITHKSFFQQSDKFEKFEVDKLEPNLPTLSPLPEIRRNNGASPSAHKISDNHRLYVSSLTPTAAGEVTQQARFSCICSSTKVNALIFQILHIFTLNSY